MRLIQDVSKLENLRAEAISDKVAMMRQNFIPPEPVGTIILLPFRIKEYYNRDCDGSAMATLEALYVDEGKLERTGWCTDCIGLGSNSGFVVRANELEDMFKTWRISSLEDSKAVSKD